MSRPVAISGEGKRRERYMPGEGERATKIPVGASTGDPGFFSAVGGVHEAAQPNPSLLRPEEMRAALRAHVRTLAKRYSPLGVAAVFLAVVIAFFPSTVAPLAHALTALPGPSLNHQAASMKTSAKKGLHHLARYDTSNQANLPSGSGGTGSGSGYGPYGSNSSYGAGSQSSLGAGSSLGNGYLPGSNGTSSYGVGPSSPSAIEPASPSSAQATCPIPAPSLPGPQIAQVDSLLLVLEGVCSVLVSSPGLLEQLPATLEGLPNDFQSGTIPPLFETLAQELAFEVVIPLLSVLPLPSSLPGGASLPSIPGLSSIPGLPFFGANQADPPNLASAQGVLSGSSYPLTVYRVFASNDAGSQTDSGPPSGGEYVNSQASRPSAGLLVGILQGEPVTKQLVRAIQAVYQHGGTAGIVLVPRTNDYGSLSGLDSWIKTTEQALPPGTQSYVSTKALVPILSGLLGYRAETLSPAESASALRAAIAGGKEAGLSVAGAMSPMWWKALASNLSPSHDEARVALQSVLASLVPGAKGLCRSQGILQDSLSQAGLSQISILSLASPGAGGPLAETNALSCASEAVSSSNHGLGNNGAQGANVEQVLQPLLGLVIPSSRI
jgi:hypothetical protein